MDKLLQDKLIINNLQEFVVNTYIVPKFYRISSDSK